MSAVDGATLGTLLPRGLVALALRRSLGWTLLFALAALGPVLVMLDRTAAAIPAGAADPLVARGLARERGWTLALFVLVPLLVTRAASHAAPWRRRDSAWLASRAPTNLAVFAASVTGACLAAFVLVLATAFVVEITLPGSSALAPREIATIRGPGSTWIAANRPCTWTSEWPGTSADGAAARARLELLLVAGSGFATTCVVRVTSPSETSETRASIGNRGALEVELPRAAGTVTFQASIPDEQARVLVASPTLTVWRADRPDWEASFHVATRLALALVAWIAVALALSTWISSPSAALGTLALWCLVWWNGAATSWIPGQDCFSALRVVAQGRLPTACPLAHLLTTLGIVLGALGLGRAGLRSWRRER